MKVKSEREVAPISMQFSMQEYWIPFPFPPPGDLPDPGVKPVSPAWAGGFFTTESSGKPCECVCICIIHIYTSYFELRDSCSRDTRFPLEF